MKTQKDYAKTIKKMMDVWEVIEKEVLKRYAHKSSTERYEMTAQLFERVMELDNTRRE